MCRPLHGLALVLMLAGTALAAGSAVDLPRLAEKAARRFPQPVRVADLVGRHLIEANEAQAKLGRVAGVVRRPDGGVDLRVSTGGWFRPTRTVSVPTEAVGLLGEHVALLDLAPAELAALPDAETGEAIPASETIRVGLTKPFH